MSALYDHENTDEPGFFPLDSDCLRRRRDKQRSDEWTDIREAGPLFDYYSEDVLPRADAPYTNGGMGAGGVALAMEKATEGYQNVWFIVTEAELWDARGLTQEWFEDSGTLLVKRSFARVDVYLYSLAAEAAGTGRRVS